MKKSKINLWYIRHCLSGILIGFSLALGFIPILIASLIDEHNLFIEILDGLDKYWKKRILNNIEVIEPIHVK